MVNSQNVVKHTWDELNRMKSVQGAQDGSVNFYRADGLRARRVTGVSIGFDVDDQGAVSGYYDTYSLDRPTWRYYHDGQGPFEDDVTYDPGSGARKDVTRYALGARGGDMAETVLAAGGTGESTVRSYPLYDGHGNTVAQVARAEDDAPGGSFVAVPGNANFELGARRKYDAWGQVRWSEGAPLDQGYCGNLQHRRDAESGLVYMRARYYEPWTGRLLSEDPAMDGANWYLYCANDPVKSVDPSGREPITTVVGFWEWAEKIFASWGIDLPNLPKPATIVANTIATVEMFASLATGADFVARTASVATASSMFLIGSSFAWVPAMCSLAASGARFAGILFRVIALVTFAQCALLMYIAEMDAYCEAGV